MKKRGFTLIELLVVIAIIAMLLAILMPALSKVKKIAQRVVCGTNLKGLGTAQTVYAHDYNDQYTCLVRGTSQVWAGNPIRTMGWELAAKSTQAGQNISVGASLYLLVREADVSPKSFVCPASAEVEFSGRNPNNLDIVELWDFGNPNWPAANSTLGTPEGPARAVSYSFHQPYSPTGTKSARAADGNRSASFAVMADKNPYFDAKTADQNAATATTWMGSACRIAAYYVNTAISKSAIEVKVGNAHPHDRDGQNVLYADGHNSYENTSDVGVMNDNIYLIRGGGTANVSDPIRGGYQGIMGTTPAGNLAIQPTVSDDSYLVNDSKAGFQGTN